MPRIKSAQKRARQTIRRTARNQHAKRLIRLTSLQLRRAVAAGDKPAVAKLRSELDSRLDRAVKKNLIHPRKGGRKKAQAARLAKPVTAYSAGRRPPAARPAKKPAAKAKPAAKTAKTPAKATPAKKPAAKASSRPAKSPAPVKSTKTG